MVMSSNEFGLTHACDPAMFTDVPNETYRGAEMLLVHTRTRSR
jgi:hypothetical protein